jgi:hypothetical protein
MFFCLLRSISLIRLLSKPIFNITIRGFINRTAVSGELAGIAFGALMETGVLVEALPLWAEELKRPETFSNPALILNIQRDGLRL